MMPDEVTLSVCMIAYNHGEYIGQAIESIVSQHTDFRFELIISDDVSSDNTRDICKLYEERFPDKIRLVFREQNLGICRNFFETLSLAKGKYVAVCEGDDYWIDNYKLQKQKEYLDNHPAASFVYHNAIVQKGREKRLFISLNTEEHIVGTEELLSKWAIPTASIVFRRSAFFIPEPFKVFTNADYYLELLLHSKGEIHYVPSIMSVYRRHEGSASEFLDKDKSGLYEGLKELLQHCRQFYSSSEQSLFQNAIDRYDQKKLSEERKSRFPFLKYLDWRFYKRTLFKKLRIARTRG